MKKKPRLLQSSNWKTCKFMGFHSEVPRNAMPASKDILELVEAKPSMINITIINNELSSSNNFVKIDMEATPKALL